jgi:hypothetical protein
LRNGDLETTEQLDCAGVEFTDKMKLVVGGLWDRCILEIAMVLTVDCYKRISLIGSEILNLETLVLHCCSRNRQVVFKLQVGQIYHSNSRVRVNTIRADGERM